MSEQVIVADIIATSEPYCADPTGSADSTAAIQYALNDCAANGGGTVFLPVGRYLVTDTIYVPSGVVLQGDWQDPDLTFINSYQGIGACLGGDGTHELLQVENVRMTALSMGYKAKLSREIGYTMDLRISPRYWSEAAEEFACSDAAAATMRSRRGYWNRV